MTRIWSLEEAQAHFEELVTAAQTEAQLITLGGAPLVTVQRALPRPQTANSALAAILGDFDFSDLSDEDLFERHPNYASYIPNFL